MGALRSAGAVPLSPSRVSAEPPRPPKSYTTPREYVIPS
jgi:hypothetical protein